MLVVMNRSPKNLVRLSLLIAVLACVGGTLSRVKQASAQSENPFIDWRPNADTQGIGYVGNKACIGCHAAKANQLSAPMGQAMEVGPDCRIVNSRGPLTFRNGPFTYQILRQGNSILYTVSDGVSSIS